MQPEILPFSPEQSLFLRPKGPHRYGKSTPAFSGGQFCLNIRLEIASEDETPFAVADYHVGIPQFSSRKLLDSASSLVSVVHPPAEPQLFRAPLDTPSPTARNLPATTIMGTDQKICNMDEASLLRHFRRTIGAWLDVSDNERHFSVHAVEIAPSSSLLLYACLATAACHLSYTNKSVHPSVADKYHEKCISILLPAVKTIDFGIDIDIILASTVILRCLEQLSARSLSQDQQRHILAGSVYINSHPDCGLAGGLAEASFWAFVLQDVQCALATRRPLRLATSSLEKGLLPTWEYRSYPTERDWAHRALWLLAETINYCYGPSTAAHMPPVISDVLKRKICDWEMQRPAIFQPLHFSPADSSSGRPFPALWFTSTSHAIAVQQICLAKALIHEHESRALHSATTNRNVKIIEIVRNLNIVLGIALSADDDPPIRIMACHALFACKFYLAPI
ncbi:hypothetical protein OAory_01111810 [Aspergillus oryzae]|uniref:Transcription factor domain-containing protein n=1 Tax=Aspergillus oryzae TaxID=5062 RepID=A0A1S9D7R6_ASPOZ|nr:hypothetical protein OAory_01111810 [Aspergillus oryzae]